MMDGPTTMNGPLHTPNVAMDDKMMSATFATHAEADRARGKLVAAGVGEDRITVAGHAAHDPRTRGSTQAADDSVIGRIREAVLPEDSHRAPREAVRDDDAILEVRPLASEVALVADILEASGPRRFDAALERWRNAG